MKKFFSVLLVSFIIFFVFSTSCLAVNISMDLDSDLNAMTSSNIVANEGISSTVVNNSDTQNADVQTNNSVNETSMNSSTEATTTNSDTTSNTVSTTTSTNNQVSSLPSLPESELGLSNILNILLIAVGFILILLAIAILLRLKK